MNNMLTLIRKDLLNFTAYRSARDEVSLATILLNANESPYDVEWDGVKINRYPEKQAAKLVNRLAVHFQVAPEQVVISRGSDEMIDLLIRLFCQAGKDSVLICPPTYGMYAIYTSLQGAHLIEVPLLKESKFQLNMPEMICQINNGVKIIFICSPNNPTGNLIKTEDILHLCEVAAGKSIVVVDEAYIDYAETTSLSQYINQFDNLVILKTLSKAYGLANLRLGMLLSNKNIIDWVKKIISPYPLSTVVTEIAFSTLSSKNIIQINKNIKSIIAERSRLYKALNKLSVIKKIWSSQANFLLIESDQVNKILKLCRDHEILIRDMSDKFYLGNAIRISVGSPSQNSILLSLLEKL